MPAARFEGGCLCGATRYVVQGDPVVVALCHCSMCRRAAGAPVVAWAIHRRAAGWRGLALTWNTLGFFDLILAVTLGVGSAVDSPVRFIYEAASSGTMSTLPWILVPGFMVPLYLMTHLAIFHRLLRRSEHLRNLRLSGAI